MDFVKISSVVDCRDTETDPSLGFLLSQISTCVCVSVHPQTQFGGNMLSRIAMTMAAQKEIMTTRPLILAPCHFFPSVLCLHYSTEYCVCVCYS